MYLRYAGMHGTDKVTNFLIPYTANYKGEMVQA